MELWNNIWIALTTTNEELIKIVSIPMIFIFELPLSFRLIVTLFNLKYSVKQKLIYVICIALESTITFSFISWPYNTIINYLFTFIILFFLFRMNFLKTLIATIFPSIVFNLISSFLALKPYLSIMHITYDQCSNIFVYRIPYALLTYLLVFVFIIILKYRKIVITVIEDWDNKNKFVMSITFVFALFFLIFQEIIISRYSDILPLYVTLLNFIFLLIYFLLNFGNLIKSMSLYAIEKKLESSESYNKTLHILHDSVRGFKHDFDNIITTIGGYIKTNDIEGLKSYYYQLESDCIKVNNLYLLNPDVINNPGIYNLLTAKYNKATEAGIKVNLYFLFDLNNLNMKIYEFARILGILLDNAIEAASENDEKFLNISFRNDSKNNRNIVLIENTYKDKNINIDDIFKKGVSGKENHTGLGLWEIRQILNKNNNVNLHTFKNNKLFSQQLEIYY